MYDMIPGWGNDLDERSNVLKNNLNQCEMSIKEFTKIQNPKTGLDNVKVTLF